MTDPVRRHTSTTRRIVSALQELIAALDGRRPHPERPGENRIAWDALTLRRQAISQIDDLSRHGGQEPYDHGLVDAIMTDDGAPPART